MPPHVDASFRFLGNSARRSRSRAATILEHDDLVHEGWLAFQEAQAKGRPLKKCYMFAENRMNTVIAQERAAQRPYNPDYRKSYRRLTPGQWHDLYAFLNRILADAPGQLKVMWYLYHNYSILEISRELKIARSVIYGLRSKAIKKLQAALESRS